MHPSGKVNLIGLVLLAGLVLAVWLGVHFVPLYVDHLDVQHAVRAAHAQVGVESDAQLRREIRESTHEMGTHVETDSWGNPVERPGLPIPDEDIVIERDTRTGEVSIEVVYTREVSLAPLDRVEVLTFRAEKHGVPRK